MADTYDDIDPRVIQAILRSQGVGTQSEMERYTKLAAMLRQQAPQYAQGMQVGKQYIAPTPLSAIAGMASAIAPAFLDQDAQASAKKLDDLYSEQAEGAYGALSRKGKKKDPRANRSGYTGYSGYGDTE